MPTVVFLIRNFLLFPFETSLVILQNFLSDFTGIFVITRREKCLPNVRILLY